MLEQNDARQAVDAEVTAIEIEPNVRPFWQAYLHGLSDLGDFWSFVSGFVEYQTKWPYDHQIDELGARVYLALGLPEHAHTLRFTEIESELALQVNVELRASRRARSKLASALNAFMNGREQRATKYLRAAHDAYGKNPEVAYNWGLTLLRNREFIASYEAIASVASAVHPSCRNQCLGTLAFLSALLDNDERAADLLAAVVHNLEESGSSLSIWDLPMWAVWMVGADILAECSDRAAKLVIELATRTPVNSPNYSTLQRVADVYRTGSGELLKDGGQGYLVVTDK